MNVQLNLDFVLFVTCTFRTSRKRLGCPPPSDKQKQKQTNKFKKEDNCLNQIYFTLVYIKKYKIIYLFL